HRPLRPAERSRAPRGAALRAALRRPERLGARSAGFPRRASGRLPDLPVPLHQPIDAQNRNHMTKTRMGATLAVLIASAALALTGCAVQQQPSTGSTSTAGAADKPCTGKAASDAKAPTGLTLALVPSGDANKLVE